MNPKSFKRIYIICAVVCAIFPATYLWADTGRVSDLVITRTTTIVVVVGGGEAVQERIVVRNPYGVKISSVTVDDILHDVEKGIVRTESFELGDMMPFEEVIITYDIVADAGVTQDMYVFSTLVKAPEQLDAYTPFNGKLYIFPSDQNTNLI